MRRSNLALALVLVGCGSGVIRGPAREGGAGPRAEPTSAEEVRVRRLLVAYEGAQGAGREVTRTREEALERATMLAGMARDADGNFRELVTEYGDLPPERDDRGEVVRVRRGAAGLSEVEIDAALALRAGQVSRPVETTAGYVILRRESDPTEAESGPASIAARHILIQWVGASQAAPSVTRSREEALALAQQLVARARAGEDWIALHREHSDEPDSPEGGDLGIFERGRMVPAFERAAFRLAVNQISEPVQSQFGYHVIQRTR